MDSVNSGCEVWLHGYEWAQCNGHGDCGHSRSGAATARKGLDVLRFCFRVFLRRLCDGDEEAEDARAILEQRLLDDLMADPPRHAVEVLDQGHHVW